MKINIAIEGRILHRNLTGSERYISELLKNIQHSKYENNYKYFLVNNSGYNLTKIPKIPAISIEKNINLYHRTTQLTNYDELFELFLAEKSVFSFLDLILCKYPGYFPDKQAFNNNINLMSMALNLSNRIISISEHSKRDVVDMFNIPAEKVDVVYLGIDVKKFRKIYDANKIFNFRQDYNLHNKYILYIGTDYPHKNIKNLLLAFTKIANLNEMKDYRLVLAGNNYYIKGSNYLNKYIEPIKDKVILLGHFDDKKITLLYNSADIFVFPSLYEGFGLPVLESFACEVPLVCSNATSLPEVAGDAAYMVNANNPDQIATAIISIIRNPLLRNSLIEKGKKRALQFTWEKCVSNTIEIYKRTILEKQDYNSNYIYNMKTILNEFLKQKIIQKTNQFNSIIMSKKGKKNALFSLFMNNIRSEGLLKATKKSYKYIFKIL
jgi:glycosyltransferase involved in cell wall biosynthesis